MHKTKKKNNNYSIHITDKIKLIVLVKGERHSLQQLFILK